MTKPDGRYSHPMYCRYWNMISRCYNPNHPRFADYGGRGIEVCDSWRLDFWQYVEDIGEMPDSYEHYTVDRINNNGNYEPDNCKWSTDEQQRQNRRPRKDSRKVS